MVSYTNDIPFATNDPSVDQPNMLINTNAIDEIIGIDHISFNATNGGTHKQVTYSGTSTPSTPTDPSSIAFTNNDSSTHPQNYFINSQATFLMSSVKAFGVFTSTTGNASINPLNSYNINTTITKPGPGQATYAITLNSNVVAGNNVIVLITSSSSTGSTTYSFSSGVLTLTQTGGAGINISFAILQA